MNIFVGGVDASVSRALYMVSLFISFGSFSLS